jgi:AmpD protein
MRSSAATAEIVQYVPFQRRAWHAGPSQWQGRSGCNDFSIGIELEGTDASAYESIQYVRLARLISALIGVYPGLSVEAVVGHSDVAPGRKTDPGLAFDWPLLPRAAALRDRVRGRVSDGSPRSLSRCCSPAPRRGQRRHGRGS